MIIPCTRREKVFRRSMTSLFNSLLSSLCMSNILLILSNMVESLGALQLQVLTPHIWKNQISRSFCVVFSVTRHFVSDDHSMLIVSADFTDMTLVIKGVYGVHENDGVDVDDK